MSIVKIQTPIAKQDSWICLAPDMITIVAAFTIVAMATTIAAKKNTNVTIPATIVGI